MNQTPPPSDRLFCFLDHERICGADCMSFVGPPDGPDFKDQAWSRCLLLIAAHRAGKHLTVLAAQGSELLKHLKISAADIARKNQPPPPTVK